MLRAAFVVTIAFDFTWFFTGEYDKGILTQTTHTRSELIKRSKALIGLALKEVVRVGVVFDVGWLLYRL